MPEESKFFWLFCQRIPGVQPKLSAKSIDMTFAPDPQDTERCGPVPGGLARHFIAFCAEKFEKINRERVYVNRFLPDGLQYSGLHVDVRPLLKHPTWQSPRAFVFNNTTTSLMFLQSFPELLYQPAKDAIRRVLTLMQQNELSDAGKELGRLVAVLPDLPRDVQMPLFYERACLYSMKAVSQPVGSPERELSLDQAMEHLITWYEEGQKGGFDAIGRTANAELYRMMSDGDLSVVRSQRVVELQKKMPTAPWKPAGANTGGGGGCVPYGTLIETPAGSRLVELIHPGDEVTSLRLGIAGQRANARVVSIKTGRADCCIQLGQGWIVTGSQPVRTADGWREASALRSGDRVMNGCGEFVTIEPPKIIHAYFEVFDLAIDDPSHNYIANGLLCHNKYPDWMR